MSIPKCYTASILIVIGSTVLSAQSSTVTIYSGDNQNASPNTQFSPLQVLVSDMNGLPQAGTIIYFFAPTSGLSALARLPLFFTLNTVVPNAMLLALVTPCRFLDFPYGTIDRSATYRRRVGGHQLDLQHLRYADHFDGVFGALSTRTIPILSSACAVPAAAQAYPLNFTAVPHEPLSYLTVWPSGSAQPTVSTRNASTGTVTANAAIVSSGTGGSINIFSTQDTDFAVDRNGYFAPASARAS